MKICCRCKQEKLLFDFNKKSSNPDGLERYCKECHRAKNRKHYESNSATYIDRANKQRKATLEWWKDYKEKLSCQVCGESRSWCLDFHHVDPSTKEGTLSSMIRSKSREAILEEITKCVVVCRNCHADIHYKQDTAQ